MDIHHDLQVPREGQPEPLSIDALRARLATAIAERDAARAEADERHEETEQLTLQIQMVRAQRDTAQAGEARAVEALKRIRDGAEADISDLTGEDGEHKLCCYCGQSNDHTDDCPHSICVEALADTPDPSWLAQQRAEAAAEAWDAIAEHARDAIGPVGQPSSLIWSKTAFEKGMLSTYQAIARLAAEKAAAFRAGATGGQV